MVEQYAAIILKKMLTNDDPGYVDLTSPAGIGIGAIVYNYDGDVYASDEGRMLAEMGDKTFRLGNLHEDSYEEIMLSDALLAPLEESFAPSAPMCQDCAFEPYCGADPTYHHATSGDFLGRKPTSGFLPPQHGDLQAAARPLRRRPGDAGTVPDLGGPLIALRGKALSAPLRGAAFDARSGRSSTQTTLNSQNGSHAFLVGNDGEAPRGIRSLPD